MTKKHCTAIVLAAGKGSRMKSDVAKQFMPICGKPLVWYALTTMEKSNIIDDCLLVTGEADLSYMKEEIVEKYGFSKVRAVVAGGKERYDSVYQGLLSIQKNGLIGEDDGYVFIHDGARPFLSEEILADLLREVEIHQACVTATPSKDTVKIADGEGFVQETPDRNRVWNIQTPQVFSYSLILNAYETMYEHAAEGTGVIAVTDDASVVEQFTDHKVKLVNGSYENMKITTPEDVKIAETLINRELYKYF